MLRWKLVLVAAAVWGVWTAGAQTPSATVATVGIEKLLDAKPARARPADFDAFWDSRAAMLRSAEMKVSVASGEGGVDGVRYEKVDLSVDMGGSALNVRAQLAVPAGTVGEGGGKYPGVLVVQYAGVYPLQKTWVTSRAQAGWLAMNVMAHDLPIDEPAEFYSELSAKDAALGGLKGYTAIGWTGRETSYMTGILSRCIVAARYFKTRPEWDGRVLVVTGGSQGGWQAICLAGLEPAISGVLANVPAGCDFSGAEVGRPVSWPYWFRQVGEAERVAVLETAGYVDAVNFAARVRCPVLVGVGLVDRTCPPEGVAVMFNGLGSAEKQLVLMPLADHKGLNDSFAPYRQAEKQWLDRFKSSR